jgi:replicative DNA helicase
MVGRSSPQQLKVPPHSKQAETSVLGAIMIDKDAVVEVADVLSPECFYESGHQAIFEAALELYEERVPIDLVTLADKLKKKKKLDNVGGRSYLSKLANSVPTSAHAVSYAQIVKDLHTKRELASASAKINQVAFDEEIDADEALDEAEQEIFSLSQQHLKKIPTSLREALAESFDRLDELQKRSDGLRGVPSGFQDLDDYLAGFQQSNLIILAARPGVGKTAWSLNIARHVAVEQKMPVCFFSLEMSKEELVDRLLVRQADIDAWKMKTGQLNDDDLSRLSEAMGILAEAPLYIDDTPGLNILQIRTKARRLQIEKGLDLIIVDYLQLMHSRRRWDSRVQEVSDISQGLKNLARELKVPVLSLSQLSRAVEKRGGNRPRLADLRESGCLTGDSKLVNAVTGGTVTIKELVDNQDKLPMTVLAIDKKYKLGKYQLIKAFSSGEKEVFELKTRSGRKIKASANHPFFKLSGWTSLEELTAGDFIGLPRKYEISGKGKSAMTNDELILLAHLIGDGCILPNQPYHYTSSDLKNIKIVKKCAERLFGIKTRKVNQKNWYHLYLPSPHHLTHGKRHPITDWYNKLGLNRVRGGKKEIPAAVFQSGDEGIKLFLRHLWATDGNISWKKLKGRKPAGAIYYSSTSEKLVYQVQHLLLRLGVLSSVRSRDDKRSKNYSKLFSVHVQGAGEQLKFLRLIGCYGKRGEIVPDLIDKLEKINQNLNNDVIPKEVWELVVRPAKRSSGHTWREFADELGMSYCGSSLFRNGVSRERMIRINAVLGDETSKNLAESDLYWDKIVSIEKVGVEEVYDVTVEGAHNFIADDVLVHNSIEQDSDVVMFLYRDDDDNRELVNCDIAKHRNGPVGQFELYFNPKKVSFFGVKK